MPYSTETSIDNRIDELNLIEENMIYDKQFILYLSI